MAAFYMGRPAVGLNRTSVGLKLDAGTLGRISGESLNRTSVGLKPWAFAALRAGMGAGLNRTSVGLKPHPHGPQNAQGQASIEPAWD